MSKKSVAVLVAVVGLLVAEQECAAQENPAQENPEQVTGTYFSTGSWEGEAPAEPCAPFSSAPRERRPPGFETTLGEQDDQQALSQRAALRLVQIQEDDGAWPYEGVYRVRRQIPVGYRIGGTAIVCEALMYAKASAEVSFEESIEKGIDVILKELENPLMKPSTEDRYDVRVWGHIYALDLFCRLKSDARFTKVRDKTDLWIDRLVSALVEEEIDGGGWNYANHRQHASFVTAPAVQALLLARSVGSEVPEPVLERAATVLQESRTEDGAFQYSGTLSTRRPAALPGSIARSAVSEATLIMLGQGDVDHLQSAVDAFYKHWDELEKRRKQTGTHEPPYNVAPYYFYYGHRYLAQAISLLPADKHLQEFERFRKVLLKTRDDDDTWNDRVFDRSKAFGTAMAILSLNPEVPSPPLRTK